MKTFAEFLTELDMGKLNTYKQSIIDFYKSQPEKYSGNFAGKLKAVNDWLDDPSNKELLKGGFTKSQSARAIVLAVWPDVN